MHCIAHKSNEIQQYIQQIMLRSRGVEIDEKPRKRVKLNIVENEEYNQFKGQAIQQQFVPVQPTKHQVVQSINIKEQMKNYQKIFHDVQKNPKIYRKVDNQPSKNKTPQQQSADSLKKQQNTIKVQQIKRQYTAQQKQIRKNEQKSKSKNKNASSKVKKTEISSNWKQFISNQKSQTTNTHKQIKKNYQFVAIDCEFVKSGEVQCLARVSLVNENGEQIYDTYVKPKKRITDFVTQVSGITYAHIKNAPSQDEVIPQLKKKMLNKIVIGHTVQKDLQVCHLKGWTGFKQVIDIADMHMYSPGGKRLSLKKLAYNELGKVIQQGWHSSVEDASATMQLFMKNKQQILKQKKIVKN